MTENDLVARRWKRSNSGQDLRIEGNKNSGCSRVFKSVIITFPPQRYVISPKLKCPKYILFNL